MISVSSLLCDATGPGDHLRYPKSDAPRPIVVWNFTRRCNLACHHCYASASPSPSPEISVEQSKLFISDIADFGVPALLFSGGEPLMHPNFWELAAYAHNKGLRLVISTNGTLINQNISSRLAELEFAEVGISLDGVGEVNDFFRGRKGAFQRALDGIRNSLEAGLRVSIRFTITKANWMYITDIFNLAKEEGVDRLCFYHLVPSGRGSSLLQENLGHTGTRQAVELICQQTEDLYRLGLKKEVLTVDNYADGAYIYQRLAKTNPQQAERALSLLRRNGGNSAGFKIAAVDEEGNVHPDQFWRKHSVGNITRQRFSELWEHPSDPLLKDLRQRKKFLTGHCKSCKYLNICNGNLRARAEAVYGNMWADDPACYLTDEEIELTNERSQ